MQKATASTRDWVTIKNAAVITGYNPEYIRQLVRAGQVAARKEGSLLRVDADALTQYKSTKSSPTHRRSGELRGHIPKNGIGTRERVADPRLTADPYLTDVSIRRHRNNVVIAHLDALSSASPVDKKEQKETYRILRRSINQDRLSNRDRFRGSAAKSRIKKERTA
jgi:hypothetical protein